jgi:hypothetical protein
VLPRPRLFKALDASFRRGVLWIVAPPGAGKTALVSSWLAARRLPHLWIGLDEGDGDVATFFHDLSRAAARHPRSRTPLPVFTMEYLSSPGGFARRLFNAIGARSRNPLVIVLDDYHEVRAGSPVHAALRDGLGELPAGVAVIVVSRDDPPAPMARLRAAGTLEVLRSDALALSEREARAIARLWGYAGRDQDVVLALHARTRGWAAGLVMLLASWREGADGQRQGSDRALLDYFSEEVLARSAADARVVLLETALVSRVTGALAVELTGVPRAGEILSDLSARGYFLERHDGLVPTYQFHALFRDFLLEKGEKLLPAARRVDVRCAAGHRLEASGQPEEAFQLYAEGGAWLDASRLIRAAAPLLLQQGRAETVARWVLAVPEEVRGADPWLQLWLGMARSPADPRGARPVLEAAFQQFERSGDAAGAYLAWAAVAEGTFFELDDFHPLDRWLEELERLQARLGAPPAPEVEARLVNAAFDALMNRQPGNPALRGWEQRALTLALSPGDPALRFTLGRSLAVFYGWWSMDLAKARVVLDTLRPLATGKHADPTQAIFWQIADADLHLHVADVDACEAGVNRGLALAAESGLHLGDPFLVMLRCLAAIMAGDLVAAARALDELRGPDEGVPRLSLCSYHYAACMVAHHRGDPEVARAHGRMAVELAVAGGMPLAEASCRLAWAVAAPADVAEEALEGVLDLARRCGTRIVQAASLLALATRVAPRDPARAVTLVREGFSVARDLGVRHMFWLTRDQLADCCALALEHGIEEGYVRDLITAQRLEPAALGRDLEAWPWWIRIEAPGAFTVTCGGEPLAVGKKEQKKPLEMLRLLVAYGPAGLRQATLAEALWPDADGDAAHHALGTTIYRLRKLLGRTEVVLQREGRVALDPRQVFVDAWALGRLVQRAGAGTCRDGLQPLQQRIRELYRGDLFGPDGDDPALAVARDRLRAKVRRSLAEP